MLGNLGGREVEHEGVVHSLQKFEDQNGWSLASADGHKVDLSPVDTQQGLVGREDHGRHLLGGCSLDHTRKDYGHDFGVGWDGMGWDRGGAE